MLSVFDIVEEIWVILIINVDKQFRRPSRRSRQSSIMSTLIFKLVKIEDLKLGDDKL